MQYRTYVRCVADAEKAEMKASSRAMHEREIRRKAAAAELQRRAGMFEELVDTLDRVAGWLESFSMPPTSTIEEKQEHLGLINALLAKAKPTGAK